MSKPKARCREDSKHSMLHRIAEYILVAMLFTVGLSIVHQCSYTKGYDAGFKAGSGKEAWAVTRFKLNTLR